MTSFWNLICDEVSVPLSKEPEWASRVPRWYQLDAMATVIAQVGWNRLRSLPTPQNIISTGANASNETDWMFAQSQGTSPSRFVHSLPNVRLSTLAQVLNWRGETLSLHHGNHSLLSSLAEGHRRLEESPSKVWVIDIRKSTPSQVSPGAGVYRVHVWIGCSKVGGNYSMERCGNPEKSLDDTDLKLLDWALQPNGRSFRWGRWNIFRGLS